jgi:hypothetical protein
MRQINQPPFSPSPISPTTSSGTQLKKQIPSNMIKITFPRFQKRNPLVTLLCFSLIVFTAACVSTSANSSLTYYVAPNGDDADSGTMKSPFATLTAARDALRSLGSLPRGGATVWVRGGTYLNQPTLHLGKEDSGRSDEPIVYRAYEDEKPVFEGSKLIDLSGAESVTDKEILKRLAGTAADKVMRLLVKDAELQTILAKSSTILSLDGKMMTLSRFPNVGFAHIAKVIKKGAEYAENRTPGPRPTYSMAEPVGGLITIREKGSGDWRAEFGRTKKVTVSGYLAYDWYKQRHRIARMNEDDSIQLLEHSRYGILNKEKIPRRLLVRNLLCEVNSAGEWYYDDIDNALFFIPFRPLEKNSMMGYWDGGTFAEINGASNIVIRGLTVSAVIGGDIISIKSGENNLVAGCTFKNSTRFAVNISGGKNNGVRSCDIYDVMNHVNLAGGDTKTLSPAGNFIENCHFTQVQAADFYGKIMVDGVGNIFRNNLVHNFIGQVMILGGNDHLVEGNEMFNIGFEEGDGGTIYTCGKMWSYGNVIRRNFLHHIMCIPQAHPRGGIYPDHLDGGETITENIFYKCAHRAVLLNGGAGHVVSKNIFLDGHIAIYQTAAWAQKLYDNNPKYDSGELKRGDITDHIWRTEQVLGEEGWNNEPWISKYPLFAKVMNQKKMRWWPIECSITDNLFCGNEEGMQFRDRWGKDGLQEIDEVEYFTVSNNRDVTKDIFVDAEQMDFRIRKSAKAVSAIPYEKIGLYADEYRENVPDKATYRNAVKAKFQKRKSYGPDAKYDPAVINQLIYFNTGKLLMGM